MDDRESNRGKSSVDFLVTPLCKIKVNSKTILTHSIY